MRMSTSFKWIAVSLLLFGACLYSYARFSTLSADIQMHRMIEQNRNRVRQQLPKSLPPDEPQPYDPNAAARRVITI